MLKNKILLICTIIVSFLISINMALAAHQLPTDLVNGTNGFMKGYATWAYNVTYGWIWVMLLAGFCIVLFIAASKYSNDRAFGYASVTGLLGSIFLITLNLMDWKIGSIFIILGIIGIVSMVLSRQNS